MGAFDGTSRKSSFPTNFNRSLKQAAFEENYFFIKPY
jgi:hypothetical protein